MTSPLWRDIPVRVFLGANLGRLGVREPDVYGHDTLADLVSLCAWTAASEGLSCRVQQTDAEHELIEWLHEAADSGAAVILNPGGWTHTSVVLRDAAAQLRGPLVEVHLTNLAAREEFRHHSYISPVATGVITGLGIGGFEAALRWLARYGRP